MARITSSQQAGLADWLGLVPPAIWSAGLVVWLVLAVVVGVAAGRGARARDRQVPHGTFPGAEPTDVVPAAGWDPSPLTAGPGPSPRPGAGTTWLCEHGGPNRRHLAGPDCPPPDFDPAQEG